MSSDNFQDIYMLWRDALRHETEQRMKILPATIQIGAQSINNWGDTITFTLPGKDIHVKPYDPRIIDDGSDDVSLCFDHGSYFHFYVTDADDIKNMKEFVKNSAERLAVDMENYLVQELIETDRCLKMRYVSDDHSIGHLMQYLLIAFDLGDASVLFPARYASAAHPDFLTILSRRTRLIVTDDLEDDVFILKPDALAFSWTIPKIEAYTPERGFCDAIRGLCLCGARITNKKKVIRLQIEGVEV